MTEPSGIVSSLCFGKLKIDKNCAPCAADPQPNRDLPNQLVDNTEGESEKKQIFYNCPHDTIILLIYPWPIRLLSNNESKRNLPAIVQIRP